MYADLGLYLRQSWRLPLYVSLSRYRSDILVILSQKKPPKNEILPFACKQNTSGRTSLSGDWKEAIKYLHPTKSTKNNSSYEEVYYTYCISTFLSRTSLHSWPILKLGAIFDAGPVHWNFTESHFGRKILKFTPWCENRSCDLWRDAPLGSVNVSGTVRLYPFLTMFMS